MRKAFFTLLFAAMLLVSALLVAAQDNATVIAELIEQALAAIDEDDLTTAQALSQGAIALIDEDVIAACEEFVQIEILLGQVAETGSTSTAFALLTTAQTLIEGCGISTPDEDDPQPTTESPPLDADEDAGPDREIGNPDEPPEARTPAEVLESLDLDIADGTIVAEPDSYVIDLGERDNTITRQRMNDSFIGDFVMGGLITWGPGADEDECGVSFRYPDWDNTDNYYALTIEQQGVIYFRTREGGAFNTTSANYETGDVTVGAGETNEIIVTGFGDVFTLYINGVQLAQFQDSTFDEGGIAVAMATFDESDATECQFDDFWVWNAGEPIVAPDGGPAGEPEILTDTQPHTPEEIPFAFDYPAGWEDVAEFSGRAYIYNTPATLADVLTLALSDDLRDNLNEIDMAPGETMIVVNLLPLEDETSFDEVRVSSLLETFAPEIVAGFTPSTIDTETLPPIDPNAKDPVARPLAYTDIDGLDMRILLAGLDNAGNTALVFIFAEPDELPGTMPAVRAVLSSLELR